MFQFKIIKSLPPLFILFSAPQFSFSKTTTAKNTRVKTSTGKAYNKKNELLYTEKHTEKYSTKGDILSLSTRYFNLKNELFAELESNFEKNKYVPEYTYSDSRMQRQDGIKAGVKEDEVIAFAKANEKKTLKEKTFKLSKALISGQGLYSYIYTNFNNLLNMTGPIDIEFLIPMQQEKYKFYIEQKSKDEKKVIYHIKFSSWLIRMFAPFIQVTYDIKTKKLIEFKGPSNVPGENGKIQNVIIKYE